MGDMILTPGGYRPRSMVHLVAPGTSVRASNDVFELHDGATGATKALGGFVKRSPALPLMPANLSRLNGKPQIKSVDEEMSLNGWISWVAWKDASGHPIESFSTEWVVPDAPTRKGNQTIFLFNGIQNSNMIYQPVLQWGISAAGGGPRWSVSCWYVGPPQSHAFCSPLIDVNPGERLRGVMELVDRNGDAFSYLCRFVGLPEAVLPIFNVEELTWANETLEAYEVTDRMDLPASNTTVFFDINLRCVGDATPVSWSAANPYASVGCVATPTIDSGNGGRVDVRYG